MNNMNWGAWLSGLIAAVANGGLTAIAAIAVLPAAPDAWQLFVIVGAPMILQFFTYLKQTPPPC